MKISIASDHGGFTLKSFVTEYIQSKAHALKDHGVHNQTAVDYADYAQLVAQDIVSGQSTFGILFCTSGIGMSIAANKIKGIRAVLVHNEDSAYFSRLHNDANIICLGQKYITPYLAQKYIELFLNTPFEGGRHLKRIQKAEIA